MRISDWSSDVCSSDLRRHDLIRVRHGEQQRLGHVALEQERAGASEYPCSEPVGQSRHGPEESMTTRGRKMFIAGNGPSLKELRSEERRVGKGCCSTCRFWWSAYH